MNRSGSPSFASNVSAWLAEHRRAVTIGVLAGTIVLSAIAALMAIALLNSASRVANEPSATARPSDSPPPASVGASVSAVPVVTPSPSAVPSPSEAAPTAAPPPPEPADWSEVAAFGASGAITRVEDIEVAPFGLIAVGVEYGVAEMPVFGPVPRNGRVWLSADGRTWEDVTPQGTFADSDIYQVVALPDGAVVAFSRVAADEGPDPFSVVESRDGRTWYGSEISIGMQPVLNMTSGGPGYVTVRRASESESELWFADDGRAFQYAFALPPGTTVASLEGGPEGFVAVVVSSDDPPVVTILASGDGLEWLEADSAPADMRAAVPLGNDWIGIAPAPPFDVYLDATTTTWFSSNGLGWSRLGSLQFHAVGADEPSSCREFLSGAIGTGSAVVVSTVFSYPCSEGGVQRFGQSSISPDGEDWTGLPFTASEVVGTAASRGATITDGIKFGDLLVIVGERDHRGTIWVNANPPR